MTRLFKIQETVAKCPPIPEELGWGIFYTGSGGGCYNPYELQKIDDADIFANDDEAIVHVVQKAIEKREGIEVEAIRFLYQESINEIDSVFRSALPPYVFERMLEVCGLPEPN